MAPAVVLIDNGADITQQNNAGKSPLDIAREKNLTNFHSLGIQHLVDCSDLLETWSRSTNEDKEEVEKKIEDLFNNDVRLIFIPSFDVAEEKREDLRRNMLEWNRCHP